MGELAPLIAFVGVVLAVFVKKPQLQHVGQIFAGLGVLFIGMDMMSAAMSPLRESEAFVSIMSNFSNPLLGILAGMIFTAIIQSSSASVGILQALANSGVIAYANSVFVLFLHRHHPQRQAHHHHPSDVQHHRHRHFHRALYSLPHRQRD